MDGKEASGSRLIISDDEEIKLKGLLQAFGSAFSLDEIASGFCKAGRDADLAGEILYKMKGSNGNSNVNGGFEVLVEKPLESSEFTFLDKSRQTNESSKQWKPKNRPVSVGSVSSVIGKHYITSKQHTDGSVLVSRPVKMEPRVLPMRGEENVNSIKDHDLHRDMEDFLFQMLGNGFKLDRVVIREVLCSFGYDMQKSMDKLLDPAATTLEKDVFTSTGMSKTISPRPESKATNESRSNGNKTSKTSDIQSTEHEKTMYDLQKEVLAALFDTSERPDESPRKFLKPVRNAAVSRRLVTEAPPRDIDIEDEFPGHTKHHDNEDEDSYQHLRKAVREYRATMKEYYQAAIDAFGKDDHVLAGKLLDQGQFFHQKAREADEESCQMILETSNTETQEELLLDLHEHETKEAIRLLKNHLSSLSGIPSIKYLKVIIETDDEDTSKGSRRRLVMKLLERASIKWTEGESAGSIRIQMDVINRKLLTFKKK